MGSAAPEPGSGSGPDPIAELITTYHELNGSTVEELSEEPSPLEFMRYVARNTPFIVRGAAADWPATRTWTAAYLRRALGRHPVNVAVTPYGNADAPTFLEREADDEGGDLAASRPESAPEPELVFAKPHEEDQPFEDFLTFLTRQELEPTASFPEGEKEVRYAQTQNDNLRHEYASLFSSVAPTVGFARAALDRDPDAINLWVGNSFSTTALHRDNYENLYVQVAGRKHFALLPPLCQPCVNERDLAPATYARVDDGALALRRDHAADATTTAAPVKGDVDPEGGGATKVPFAIWDPELPDRRGTPYSHLARPMDVTLNPGDMLYLPAMWYHKVSQSSSEDGICVAVNYWYDMEFSGPLYPLCSFVRDVYQKTST